MNNSTINLSFPSNIYSAVQTHYHALLTSMFRFREPNSSVRENNLIYQENSTILSNKGAFYLCNG